MTGLTSGRQDLPVSQPPNLGMDFLSPSPKRLSAMANLWSSDDNSHMGLGKRCERNRVSRRDLLCLTSCNVHTELRAGRLGNF